MENYFPVFLLAFIAGAVAIIMLPPIVSLPSLAVIAALAAHTVARQGFRPVWKGNNLTLTQQQEEFPEVAPPRLKLVAQCDPHFSAVLFLDFARLLYERFLAARYAGPAALASLRPHLAPSVQSAPPPAEQLRLAAQTRTASGGDGRVSRALGLDSLPGVPDGEGESRPAMAVEEHPTSTSDEEPSSADLAFAGKPPEDLLVGPANVAAVELGDPDVDVVFEFGSTLTDPRDGRPCYVCERVTYRRSTRASSPDPIHLRSLGCPRCGGAIDGRGGCPRCPTPSPAPGLTSWSLAAVETLTIIDRAEFDATPAGCRGGTVIQSAVDNDALARQERDFLAAHGDFSLDAFRARVQRCFVELLDAWSSQRWERVRAFMTASLHESHTIEVARYRRQGWINHVEDVVIKDVVPVKFAADPFFNLITVWITASARDWTTDDKGVLLAGDATRPITFHEYWSFIRRRDVGADGADEQRCPGCGAVVKLPAPQECAHCGDDLRHVEFEWTLAAMGPDSTEWT